MKAFIPLLLLAGCAGWPTGSYVDMAAPADAAVLAPAIAECVGYMAPLHTPVALAPAVGADAFSALLTDALTRNAVTLQPDGRLISYVVAPLDQGTFISVSSPPHARCGQYFSHAAGPLKSDGSMMVTP